MTQEQCRFVTVDPYHYLASVENLDAYRATVEIGALFGRLSDLGVTGVVWNACVFGKALYRTTVATPLENDRRASRRPVASALRQADILEAACGIGREAGLELHVAVRIYNDYFPGLGSDFEAAHPETRWESRDGEFSLRGVTSLAYDSVMKYRLAIVDEIAEYDAAGVLIDLGTNAAAFTPFRRRDFFGYNAPVVDAHRQRTGEDPLAFDDVCYRRGADLQIVDAIYDGGDFDTEVWHAVKGEAFERFLKNASEKVRAKGRRMGLSRGREEGILPTARMRLDAAAWLAGGVIDDLVLPGGPGDDADLGAYLKARKGSSRVIVPEGLHADGAITFLTDLPKK